MAALLFFSGRCVSAEPVGDFFKKVSQSVSKAFQPQTTPNPTKKKTTTKHASRRPTSPQSKFVEASPTPLEQPTEGVKQPTEVVKEEKVTPAVRVQPAASVPSEKAKADLPYGIPVPGHKGMVTSPYSPEGNYIDVSAFPAGSAVRDPYTGKIFLVP